MTERDQKMKITHKPAATYRDALACCVDRSRRALSVRKKSATPWIMLTRVSSMLTTTESSSWRPLLSGFTTRLVTAQRLNCQGASRSGSAMAQFWVAIQQNRRENRAASCDVDFARAEHIKPRKIAVS